MNTDKPEVNPAAQDLWDSFKQSAEIYSSGSVIPKTTFGSSRRRPRPPVDKIKPLTQDEWNAMEGKARWDSTVGLRGPDFVGSGNLKFFTSSIIRWKMSGIMRVGGLVNDKVPFVVLPEGFPDRSRGQFDAMHFCEHIREAAMWLNIPIAIIPWEVFKSVLLSSGDYYWQAGVKILDHLQEPYKSQLKTLLQAQYLIPADESEAPSCE